MGINVSPAKSADAKRASSFLAGICAVYFTGAPAMAQTPYDPTKTDPADFTAVKQVCTVCHDTSRLMHSRPWSDWLRVLGQMSDYGAKGSDEQWDQISRFLLLTLTTLDVNTAPAEEIGPL